MTIRQLPRKGLLIEEIAVEGQRLQVCTLSRTDEFWVAASGWDTVNWPVTMPMSHWDTYLEALKPPFRAIDILPHEDRPIPVGIAVWPSEEGVFLCQYVNSEVGAKIFLSSAHVEAHRLQAEKVISFLLAASENTEYPVIE